MVVCIHGLSPSAYLLSTNSYWEDMSGQPVLGGGAASLMGARCRTRQQSDMPPDMAGTEAGLGSLGWIVTFTPGDRCSKV